MIDRRDGFTLIELLVTIVIMTILLTLVVVNLRSSQATARDEERKTDINIIAQQLEDYYAGNNGGEAGRYPAVGQMDGKDAIRSTLRDIDIKALQAPGTTGDAISLMVATNNSSTQSPPVNTYIYQPLTSSGQLCTEDSSYIEDECRRYVLYYQLETVPGVQTLISKNQ